MRAIRWNHVSYCAAFSDAGNVGQSTRGNAGVGEAPRHEVAGERAPTVQRALWRLSGAAAVRVLSVRPPAAVRGRPRGLMRFIEAPQARLMTMFGGHRVVRMATGAIDGAAGE